MYETDILNPDTDLDGLTDYEEVYITLTSPTKYDSINEGISDSDVDVDYNDLSNIQEINLGTNSRLKDTDNDGLSDSDEILLYNTNPLVPDTDEDGITDGNEITMGLDPNDPETFDVPDTEYSVNQTISSENVAFSKINSKDNPYEASLDVKIADMASKAVVIKESPYTETLSNNQSIIGKVISISYNKPVDSSVLKFQIKQEYINDEIDENETGLSGINKYHIFCYDENNILHPVETHITDNELSTDATTAGDYCIIISGFHRWILFSMKNSPKIAKIVTLKLNLFRQSIQLTKLKHFHIPNQLNYYLQHQVDQPSPITEKDMKLILCMLLIPVVQ